MIAIQQVSNQFIALFGIEVNWWHGFLDLINVTVAYLLALPIGWHRLRAERGIGLRTYPLVAIASCTFLLVGETISGTPKADPRLIQGLMTGIGFLGAGAILKRQKRIHGIATAASIWSTAAMGAAFAYRSYELAAILSFVTFVTMQWFPSPPSVE
jgi:putative Mg2+ transporter-C (MgtC) family protein